MNKRKEEETKGGEKKGGENFRNLREGWANEGRKNPTSTFGLIWVHPKTMKTNPSTTSALMGAGSQQPPSNQSLLLYHNT
jgi:hypothetical protein